MTVYIQWGLILNVEGQGRLPSGLEFKLRHRHRGRVGVT